MIIIVDSDGLIGSLNISDAHFNASQKIILTLKETNSKLIYPATVIAETVTLLQARLNRPDLASQIIQLIDNNFMIVEPVDIKVIQQASRMLDFKRSKHNTLFDCIVATIAERRNADAIFSFDKFYQKKGFKLASEL